MRTPILLVASCIIVAVVASCSSAVTPIAPSASAPDSASLPALPLGGFDVKHSQLTDDDFQDADAAIDTQHSVGAGGHLVMVPQGPPTSEYAYAVYQSAERPEPPSMFTIECQYYDPDPLVERAGAEGFWFAYGDYDLGSWVFSGPYTTSTTRIPVPPGAAVKSPGGFIYCALLVINPNIVTMHSVSTSYYTASGYESTWLALPQGNAIQEWADIQLDNGGNPQIAYLFGDMMDPDTELKLRVAAHDGSAWSVQNVPTSCGIQDLQFAIGAGNRRAILALTKQDADLHLLYDDGGGTFDTDIEVATALNNTILPGLAFINGDGIAEGELDTVLVIHAQESAGKYDILYHRHDDVNPPVTGDVFSEISKAGRLELVQFTDSSAQLLVPWWWADDERDARFRAYNAATDTWGPSAIPDWEHLPVEDDYVYNPSFLGCELPSGEMAVLYDLEDDQGVAIGQTSAGVWPLDIGQIVPCWVNTPLDMAAYSTGEVGFMSAAGFLSPVLLRKDPSAAGPAEMISLDENISGGFGSWLAIGSDDIAHVATYEFNGAGLLYYRVETDGTVTKTTVDNGGLASGAAMGKAVLTAVDDHLHVFYADAVHRRLLHAENVAGVWTRDGEVIPGIDNVYLAWQAGYLADADLLYVAYVTFPALTFDVATFRPDGSDYQSNTLLTSIDSSPTVADDESSVGIVSMRDSEMLETLEFSVGPPRQAPHPSETVSSADDISDYPYHLDFNTVTGKWAVTTQDYGEHYCFIFERTSPGNWHGPFTVASQLGANATATGCGLSHRKSDGATLVTVQEQETGSDIWNLNVYAGSAATGSFDAGTNVLTLDKALFDVNAVETVPATSGEPLIAVEARPTGDPHWNYEVAVPDGGGGWSGLFTWTTTIMDAEMGIGMAALNGTEPALAVLDMEASSGAFGRVLVYYPW